MISGGLRASSLTQIALIAAVVAAMALRIAMAQGGLWLDEAWSALFAHQARTPLGVFLAIHHDNNHHLNTLWMQAVGIEAAPVVHRALAIVSGTLSVSVAAAIGFRRNHATGLAAALLFALSPILTTYGAEARGYAPMALAVLIAILLLDRWIGSDEDTPPRLAIGLCFAIAALAQLTALFALAAIGGWVLLEYGRRTPPLRALRLSFDLMLPSLAVMIAMFLLVFLSPRLTGQTMSVGAYIDFTWSAYWQALSGLASHLIAQPAYGAVWPIALALASLAAAFALRLPRRGFYVLAILCFPAGMALVQPANIGNSRYYLIAALALLLLWADLFGLGWRRGGIARWAAVAALGGFALSSLSVDRALIADARGNPDGAVRLMARLAPGGGTLLVERKMGRAVHEAAARRLRYPIHIILNGCAPADFLVINRFRVEPFGDHRTYCGQRWRPLAEDRSEGMTEESWRLYRRID